MKRPAAAWLAQLSSGGDVERPVPAGSMALGETTHAIDMSIGGRHVDVVAQAHGSGPVRLRLPPEQPRHDRRDGRRAAEVSHCDERLKSVWASVLVNVACRSRT
jgi:hypothetical protein